MTTRQCSTLCFETALCMAFSIDENSKCYLERNCLSLENTAKNHVIYVRFASAGLNCYRKSTTTLPLSTIPNTNIALGVQRALFEKITGLYVNFDVIRTVMLDESNFQNSAREAVCYIGVMIKYEEEDHHRYTNNHVVFDGDTKTCYNLKNTTFKARMPWPSSQERKYAFNVEVTGKYLTCMDSSKKIGNKGIFIYVNAEDHTEPSFEGKFSFCRLLNENDERCEYECNCHDIFCEAVYANMYDVTGVMKVCLIVTIFVP